ncbi:MAG TPA: hypothetical protein VGE07_02240, partial [Herpetosiphonaceae bacterium]
GDSFHRYDRQAMKQAAAEAEAAGTDGPLAFSGVPHSSQKASPGIAVWPQVGQMVPPVAEAAGAGAAADGAGTGAGAGAASGAPASRLPHISQNKAPGWLLALQTEH